ncbi:sensor histidine kinase [Myxococcota bacterium]|nr:sensor histidine kinase [Myxococcota bacterium]
MTPTPLAPAFARRMAPLALLAGLVFGVILPAVHHTAILRARTTEARLWAQDVAAAVERSARLRPVLWAYDVPALSHAVDAVVRAPVHGHVRIDARRDGVFEAGPLARPDEVVAFAPILVEGRTVGRVQIRLDVAFALGTVRAFWIAALLGGAALAAALYFLPVATVRRGDARDAELWRALQAANATLEARVADRTRALREREAELSALGARLLEVQEAERARISRDLHDELGQTLTGLRLRLTTLASVLDPAHRGQEHLGAALSAVDAGVEQVRHLAHRMRPAALDGLGLAAALRAHAEQWAADAGLEVHFELDPAEPPPAVAEVLFRVAQEALTNVARHADARVVTLACGPFDDGWRLVIGDDGRGLPPPDPARRRGLGLVGARERVEAAGGYLDLESGSPRGVRLVAWLPPS